MDRRSFLFGTAGLGLALAGCSNANSAAFRVRLLKNSVPSQLVGEFKKQLQQLKDASLDLKPEEQLQTLFADLQVWKQTRQPQNSPSVPFLTKAPEAIPDLITLGDAWLETAIRQGLLQPLDANPWQQWNQLPAKWKAIVTRTDQGLLAQNGKVWGAPYRWGATVIAYRTDIFRDKNLQPPKDWSDLWREDLRGRISLLDQPRETIGLTLKKLGKSYNTSDLNSVKTLESELHALHRQAKLYSSTHYLEPLILDDTWVAVGWSTDILQTMRRNPTIAAVFPTSGTALFTDVWVRPASAAASQTVQALLPEWINFFWKPDIVPKLALLGQVASPILTQLDAAQLPMQVQQNSVLLPPSDALDRSEFLEPLSDRTIDQFRSLWEKVRRAT